MATKLQVTPSQACLMQDRPGYINLMLLVEILHKSHTRNIFTLYLISKAQIPTYLGEIPWYTHAMRSSLNIGEMRNLAT